MTPRWADRPGCPQCRAKLVRRLRGEPWTEPGFGPGLPVRHYEMGAAAAIFAAVAVLSAGIAAYGQYAQSQQQSASLQYNAILANQQAAYQQQVAEFQAQLIERQAAGALTLAEAQAAIQEQQAIAAEAAGRVREAAIRRNYNRTQSDVRAAIGKSGVDTTGSPLLVLIENADTVGQELALNDYQTALDVAGAQAGAAFARTEGALRAGSLTGEAGLARFGGAASAAAALSQSSLLSMQAGSVRSAGMFNVGTTLLGGIGSAASPYLRYGMA
jgi:hypothetical protein